MRKVQSDLPPHDLEYYFLIADAAYAEDPAGYLAKNHPNTELLGSTEVLGWGIILVKDRESGFVAAGFRGSETDFYNRPVRSAANWFFNLMRTLTGEYGLIPSFEKNALRLALHQLAYKCNVVVHAKTGHSAGGTPASQLREGEQHSVTFNAHLAKGGPRQWNFRLKEDVVSGPASLFRQQAYIVLNPSTPAGHRETAGVTSRPIWSLEAHNMTEIRSHLKDKKFVDFTDDVALPLCGPRGPFVMRGDEFTRAAATFAEATNSIESAIEPILKQEDTDFSRFQIDDIEVAATQVNDAEFERGAQAGARAGDHAINSGKRGGPSLESILAAANQMIGSLANLAAFKDSPLDKERRRVDREGDAQNNRSSRLHHSPQAPFTVPRLVPSPVLARTEYSISDRLKEAQDFLGTYRDAMGELRKKLATRKEWVKEGNRLEGDLNSLDDEIREAYRDLCGKARRLSRSFQVVTSIFQCVGSVATCAGQPAIGQALNIAATVASVGQSIFGASANRRAEGYQAMMQRNLGTRSSLAQSVAASQQEMHAITEARRQAIASLKQNSRYFDPKDYREELDKARPDVAGDISQFNFDKDKLGHRISQLEKDINLLDKRIDEYHQKKFDKKHDYEKYDTKEKAAQTERNYKAEELLELKRQKKAIEEALASTEEDLKKLDKDIEMQKALACVADPLFAAVKAEADRWKSESEETEEYRQLVKGKIADFDKARDTERQLVKGTFTAVDTFLIQLSGTGFVRDERAVVRINQARKVINLSTQVYSIYDQSMSWSFAIKSLSTEADKLQKKTEGLSQAAAWLAAAKELGLPLVMGEIIFPGISLLGAGLSLLGTISRLIKKRETPQYSLENQLLKAIGERLETQRQEMGGLIEKLSQQDEGLKEQLVDLKGELALLSQEIQEEIERSRRMILDRMDLSDYREMTTETLRIGTDLDQDRYRFSDRSVSAPIPVYDYLSTLEAALRFHTDSPIFGGAMPERSASGLEAHSAMVPPRLVAKNPSIYSPLIGLEVEGRPAPSLYLLQSVMDSLVAVLRFHDRNSRQEKLKLDAILSRLAPQVQRIMRLTANLGIVVDSAREAQNDLVTQLRRNVSVLSTKRTACQQEVVKAALSLEEVRKALWNLTKLKSLTGASKFFYAVCFCSPLNESYQGYPYETMDEYHDRLRRDNESKKFGGRLLGTVGAVGGALVAGPAGAVAGSTLLSGSYVSLVNNAMSNKEKVRRGLQDTYIQFEYKSVADLAKHALGIRNPKYPVLWGDDLPKLDYFSQVKISIWLAKSWALRSNAEGFYPGNKKSLRMHRSGPVDESSPFRASLTVESGKVTMETEGLFKTTDLSKLDKERHIPMLIRFYNKRLLWMTTHYRQWMICVFKGQTLPKDNIFYGIHERATIVPSRRVGLVPLAIPTKLLEELHKQEKVSLNRMESTGVGTLVTFYNLQQDIKTQRWNLTIDFCIEAERTTISGKCFKICPIGSIDQAAAAAFAPPSIEKTEREVNQFEKHLNEMLLQALYTRLVGPDLGMPASGSIFLENGQLLAPEELPFPGFFELWDAAPSCSIDFNAARYTEEVKDELFKLVAGESYSDSVAQVLCQRGPSAPGEGFSQLLREVRNAERKLTPAVDALAHKVNALRAHCCFLSNVPDNVLQEALEQQLNLVVTGDLDDLIAHACQAGEEPAVTSEVARRFEGVLLNKPSVSLSRFEDTVIEIGRGCQASGLL